MSSYYRYDLQRNYGMSSYKKPTARVLSQRKNDGDYCASGTSIPMKESCGSNASSMQELFGLPRITHRNTTLTTNTKPEYPQPQQQHNNTHPPPLPTPNYNSNANIRWKHTPTTTTTRSLNATAKANNLTDKLRQTKRVKMALLRSANMDDSVFITSSSGGVDGALSNLGQEDKTTQVRLKTRNQSVQSTMSFTPPCACTSCLVPPPPPSHSHPNHPSPQKQHLHHYPAPPLSTRPHNNPS